MKKKLLLFGAALGFSVSVHAQWLQQATGFTTTSRGIRDISIVSPTAAWAVSFNGIPTGQPGAGVASQDFTRTTNGGTTWTPGTIPGAAGFQFTSISATDANTAWVTMYNSTTGEGRIYHSSNGGTTWTRQNTAGFASAPATVIHFFNATDGVAAGLQAGGFMEIYTTTNGGSTWTRVPQANIPAPLTNEYPNIDVITAVGNTVWMGTSAGRVLKSTDKGLNWTVATTTLTSVSNIVFRDANNGLVRNAGTLLRTTNGGTTWAPVTTTGTFFKGDIAYVPGTTSTYVSVGFATTGTTLADYGSSYSTDDGVTWNTISTNQQYTVVDFFNPTTGWAGSYNNSATSGGIYKATRTFGLDVSVTGVSAPTSGCGRTATEQVCINVTNNGIQAASNVPVSYRVNNGAVVTGTVAGPIAAGTTANFCFTGTANLSTAGNYTIRAYSTLSGDLVSANDTATFTVQSQVAPASPVVRDSTVCAGSSVVLRANTPSDTIAFFTAATGGSVAGMGRTLRIDTLTANTTFYAQAFNLVYRGSAVVPAGTVGKLDTVGGSFVGNFIDEQVFNVFRPIRIDSVTLYADAAGSFTFALRNGISGPIIDSVTVSVVAGRNRVPFGLYVPVGNNLTLGFLRRNSGTGRLVLSITGGSYPYTIPGVVSITGTSADPATLPNLYMYFFNWRVSLTGCESARVPVTATIAPAPAVSFTASQSSGNTYNFNNTTTGATTYLWNFGDNSATSTAQNPTHTYASSGTYVVTLIATNANGCTDSLSQTITVVTGINEEAARFTRLYPNPSAGNIVIERENMALEAAEVAIYSIHGQLVKTYSLDNQPRQSLNLQELPAGAYILKITGEKATVTKQIVLQK